MSDVPTDAWERGQELLARAAQSVRRPSTAAEILKSMAFTTKDSGRHEEFTTGSRRDTRAGKGRYDLLSVHALRREAQLLERGAVKYGERNWEKGQPAGRFMDSLLRHAFQYLAGDRSEDHLAAVRWNAGCIIHFEELGRTELMDIPVAR